MLSVNDEYKSLSRAPGARQWAVWNWPGPSPEGLCVSVQVWRGGNLRTVCLLRDITADFPNFIPCQIMMVFPDGLADNACFQTHPEDLRKPGPWSSLGWRQAVWIRLSQPCTRRVTYQSRSPFIGRKWSVINMEVMVRLGIYANLWPQMAQLCCRKRAAGLGGRGGG